MEHKIIESNKIVTTIILIGVIISSSVFFIQKTEAASISPLTFELSANPGDSITNTVRIFNDTGSTAGVSIDVEDFVAAGEEGKVSLQTQVQNHSYALSKWVTVSPRTFTLEENESKSIEFTINVPLDAEPGGHYSSILASIGNTGPVDGGVGISSKIGSLVLLNVSGDITEKIHIAEFSAPNYSEYGPVTLVTRFQNNGTIHTKPRGFILIKNMFGKEIDKTVLDQKNVLPNSIRRIEVNWGRKYMFGRYEATLASIYGNNNEPLSSTITFWVLPWKILLVAGIGVMLLLAVLISGRKRIRLALSIIFKGAHHEQMDNNRHV